jgi:hypothetical protein
MREKFRDGDDDAPHLVLVRTGRSEKLAENSKQGAALCAALGEGIGKQEGKRILKEIRRSPELSDKLDALVATMKPVGGKKSKEVTFDYGAASDLRSALDENGILNSDFFKARSTDLSSIPVPQKTAHQYATIETKYSVLGIEAGGYYQWVKTYGGRSGTLSLGYIFNPDEPLSGLDYLWKPLRITSSLYSDSGTGGVGLNPSGFYAMGFTSQGLGFKFDLGIEGGIPKLVTTPPKDWGKIVSSLDGGKPRIMFDAVGGPIGDTYSLGKFALTSKAAGFAGIYAVIKAAIDIGYSIGKRLYEAVFPTFKRPRGKDGDVLPSEKSHVQIGTGTMEECVAVLRFSKDDALKSMAAKGITGLLEADMRKYSQGGSSDLTLTDLERLCKFMSKNASFFEGGFLANAYAYRDSRRLLSKRSSTFNGIEDMKTSMDSRGEGFLGNFLSGLFSVDELAVGKPVGIRWHGWKHPIATIADTVSGWFEGLFEFKHTKQARSAAGKVAGALMDVAGDIFDFAGHIVGTFSPVFFRSDNRKDKVRQEIMERMEENERLFFRGAKFDNEWLIQNRDYLVQMMPYVSNGNNSALMKKISAHFEKFSLEYEITAVHSSIKKAQNCLERLANPTAESVVSAIQREIYSSIVRMAEAYVFLKSMPEPKDPSMREAYLSGIAEAETYINGLGLMPDALKAVNSLAEIRQGTSKIAGSADSFVSAIIKANGNYSAIPAEQGDIKNQIAEANGLSNTFNVYRLELAAHILENCDLKAAKEAIGLCMERTAELVSRISDGIKDGLPAEKLDADFELLKEQLLCLKFLSFMFPVEYSEKYHVLSKSLFSISSVNSRIRYSLSGISEPKKERSIRQFELGYTVLAHGVLSFEDQQYLQSTYGKMIGKNNGYRAAAERVLSIEQE